MRGATFDEREWREVRGMANNETPEARAEEWVEESVRYHVARVAAEVQFSPQFVGETQWLKVLEMLARLMAVAEEAHHRQDYPVERQTSR